jgi:hypothetical protein
LWFTYVHLHNISVHPVTQRVKLVGPPTNPGRLERFANVTNYIFNQGYLASKLRPVVHWEEQCGKRIEEHLRVEELLLTGAGASEDKPLRLVIGMFAPSGTKCLLIPPQMLTPSMFTLTTITTTNTMPTLSSTSIPSIMDMGVPPPPSHPMDADTISSPMEPLFRVVVQSLL